MSTTKVKVISKFPCDIDGPVDDWFKEIDDNWKALVKQDSDAKKSGRLVGRYISEGYADGSAYYVVVKENKSTVKIEVATGIGDDWVFPCWGEEFTITKDYALRNIKRRD